MNYQEILEYSSIVTVRDVENSQEVLMLQIY